MAESFPIRMNDNIIQKGCALAEKRRAYLAELYSSGRWELYYTEPEFRKVERQVIEQCAGWKSLTLVGVDKVTDMREAMDGYRADSEQAEPDIAITSPDAHYDTYNDRRGAILPRAMRFLLPQPI